MNEEIADGGVHPSAHLPTDTNHVIPAAAPLIVDGWFHERGALWPGQAMTLQVDRVLHHSRSAYQDVLVFESRAHGRVLVLDGAIQLTERDEFAYQEMLAHLPMFAHSQPRRVLVVGGGDGGVLREVLRHDGHGAELEQVVLCELDAQVMDVSRRLLPSVSAGALDGTHPKVRLEVRDGAEFMRQAVESFDVIITDASDPVGPAQVLFELPFYQAVHASLRDGGLVCVQGECLWLHLEWITVTMQALRRVFDMVEYACASVPTYPSGQIGFIICGKGDCWRQRRTASVPAREPPKAMRQQLRYYNSRVHQAAFVLPEFAHRAVYPVEEER
ncbi:hypothetical protein CDCA_CDCA05G1460 [Cyanidium caldarium]|uniref:PABS domain-containing protein n=1 Tax=Cyanidium caldarium TaxID=2771 RepID=A0AAV9ITK8_CYACA|nr:hypothetical protein CDCA_CDCA05G1460 [Cyanidium caldarium]